MWFGLIMNNRIIKMEKGGRPLTEQVNTWGEKKATGSELWEHMAQDGRSNGSHRYGLKETEARKIYHWQQ